MSQTLLALITAETVAHVTKAAGVGLGPLRVGSLIVAIIPTSTGRHLSVATLAHARPTESTLFLCPAMTTRTRPHGRGRVGRMARERSGGGVWSSLRRHGAARTTVLREVRSRILRIARRLNLLRRIPIVLACRGTIFAPLLYAPQG